MNPSLIVTPNAYKAGKLYSAVPSDGTGDFTVTRATSATRVNNAGLIEIPVTNLILQSEAFENASWTKLNVTVNSNTAISPNGVQNADFIMSTNNPTEVRTTTAMNVVTGQTYTWSIYAKNAGFNLVNLTAWAGDDPVTIFNLDTISIVIETGPSHQSTITDVGNGWRRLTITRTVGNSGAWLRVKANNPFDNVNGIYIWGAQLEQNVSATEYIPTTSVVRTKFAGITQDGSIASNIPRLDYTNTSCPSILVEQQRTNLLLQSEQIQSLFFGGSWSFGSIQQSLLDITISPSGLLNADKIFPSTTTGSHFVFQLISNNNTVTQTASCYFKASEYTRCGIRFGITAETNSIIFDLISGQIVLIVGNVTGTITSVGNGWYRCTATITGPTNLINIQFCIIDNNSTVFEFTGNSTKGLFIWGAQLELGGNTTSYIPTTTAAVTRNADMISRDNIYTNGLVTNAGGTMFIELKNNIPVTASTSSEFNLGIGSSINGYGSGGSLSLWNFASLSSRLQIIKNVGGTFSILYTSTTDNCKIAIKWNGSTADIFENGVKVVNATVFTTTNMNFLYGSGARRSFLLNKMFLFPTPLTDSECISLTTL